MSNRLNFLINDIVSISLNNLVGRIKSYLEVTVLKYVRNENLIQLAIDILVSDNQ